MTFSLTSFDQCAESLVSSAFELALLKRWAEHDLTLRAPRAQTSLSFLLADRIMTSSALEQFASLDADDSSGKNEPEYLYEYLQGYFHTASDRVLSQRKFWHFVRGFYEAYSNSLRANQPPSIGKSNFVADGQRYLTFNTFNTLDTIDLDLSSREIRSIVQGLICSVREFEGAGTINVLSFVHESLRREIEARARKRTKVRLSPISSGLVSIRDRILSHSIRTGISPPALAAQRLAEGKALVCNTAALQVEDEAIRKFADGVNLQYPVRSRRAKARIDCSSRKHAIARRIAKHSRCRRNGAYRKVGENRGSLRAAYRWEMVRNFRMAR